MAPASVLNRTPARPLSNAARRRLATWAGRPPRAALMGEFSAGKSTLLNFIVGRDCVPTQVTATQLPAIRLRHGETVRASVLDHEGRRRTVPPEEIAAISMAECAMLGLETPDPMLRDCEIIDTPGISDPLLTHDVLPLVAGNANFVIWCTHATQAWRASEKAVWEALPERLRHNSILVATRADRLSATDREKVRTRLERETAGLFREIVFLATPQAAAARENRDDGAWRDSGGEAFDAAFRRSIGKVHSLRGVLLERHGLLPLDTADIEETPGPAVERPTPPDPLPIWDVFIQRIDYNFPKEHIAATILDFTDNYLETTGYEDHQNLDWTHLLHIDTSMELDTERVLQQVRAEIGDFADQSWRSL